MEVSHHASALDPSSVLGFGSALALLDSREEVARLLTGALRSMGLADLQAVVLDEEGVSESQVFGSVGTKPLSDPVLDDLRRFENQLSLGTATDGSKPSLRQVQVSEEEYAALAQRGIRRLSTVRLGTIDREFGVAVAGLANGATHTPLQASSLQMMAAQVSMALHRIELDQERAAQEASLQKSEARYRELYESAPVAYVSVTPDGEIRMANQRATELFGISEDTLIGRSVLDFCAESPGGQTAARRLGERLQSGEAVRDDEVELCLANGDRIWVSLTMRSLTHSEEEAERLVMMVDVTERKRMETALRSARDELESRVEERTKELRRANEQLEQQTQRLEALRDIDQAILAAESPREIATIAARRAQDVVPCERASVAVIDSDAERARILAVHQDDDLLERGTEIPLDEFYLTDSLRDGQSEIISDLASQSVPAAGKKIREAGIRSVLCLPMMVEGELIGTIKIGHPRPGMYTNEDRLVGRELADHLAVALRQARLLERVQRQTERLEERVQERTAELESFTYSVSHDLRTPLRAIDGYTRILREEHADQLDEEGQRLLNVVYDSAQTMSDLIDDLLTLSRLGRREMNRAPIDMDALVREVYDELRRTRPTEDVTFELGSLPDVVGDRSMLRHVLTNLLSNAIKFTRDEERPQIRVEAEERDGEAVYVVHDNGVGFDEDRADKLFGVFQRLHEEDEFEGTGVGLAIVERIIRRHGGRVWAEGTEGEGASFFFALPGSDQRM